MPLAAPNENPATSERKRQRSDHPKVFLLLLLAVTITSTTVLANPTPDFTERDARVATLLAIDQTAGLLDGKPRVGACPRKGQRSRVCTARITGAQPVRLRVVVTDKAANEDYWVRMRILRVG